MLFASWAFWRFSGFLLIFRQTNVNWDKKIIQNIDLEGKLHAESDSAVRKIHKIHFYGKFYFMAITIYCLIVPAAMLI